MPAGEAAPSGSRRRANLMMVRLSGFGNFWPSCRNATCQSSSTRMVGFVSQAVQIGVLLRENRMTAGVARTVPEGCHLGFPLDDGCRRLMQSKREHKAKLYFGGARCGSACVYALVGASTRHVDAGATLRIHSGRGPEVDKAENFLRRYIVGMGVDPALVDTAAEVPSRTFRGLSRGEMERFGIETRGVHETPWFAFNGPAGD